MGRTFIFALCTGLLLSCGDNDLDIETIDFNDIAIGYCTAPRTNAKNVLFKINETESLILELQSGVLGQGVVGDTVITQSTLPSQSQLTYRIFSGKVTKNYFCDAIPTVDPQVIDQVGAEGGTVIVETMALDTVNFVHRIRLAGISFVTGEGERITNMNIEQFGEVTTAIP